MRPVRLEVKGFTAYREAQVLDLEDLDLFAITGPTGSGKSSLLDAMTYALYGRAPRIGNRAALLIAQGQPRLAVMLDFTVDGDRYRVTRSTGQRAASATVRLERWVDGHWQSFGDGADRIRDATRSIEDLIGLDYAAFTRSVLLPQGEFQEFLVGDPAERRRILTELLGLELFVRMARRAGEQAAAARAGAQATRKVLQEQYEGVDKGRLREARAAAKDTAARSRSIAEIERSVEGLAKESRTRAARIDAIDRELAEAGELARSAEEVAAGLEEIAADADRGRARVAELAEAASQAGREVDAATRALTQAEERRGSAEAMAELRATVEALGRVRGRTEGAESKLSEALTIAKDREAALERARRAAAEAGASLERAERTVLEAESEHDRVHTADRVAALVRGKAVGDPCPVCERPMEAIPRIDVRGLEEAVRVLETARTLQKRAEAAWGKADRDGAVAERDLDAARQEVGRREADVAGCVAERDALVEPVAEAFGGTLPDDPLAEIQERTDLIRGLREALAAAETVAAEATATAGQANDAVRSLASRSGELIGSLRGLALGRLLERTRELLPGTELPNVPAKVPAEPTAAASAARRSAAAALGVSERLRNAAAEARREREELLDRARESMPPGVPVAMVTDVDELLQAIRATATQLVEAATAARKDAERMAEQMKERHELEQQAGTLEREAAVYHVLASELRADRLIDFLQGEALELLAAAGSERLLFLSQGRYRLAFEDDEFFVEDAQNGDERRSVRTLSGGETFLASLALALALSDQIRSLAVTSRAPLRSLFIDEGFGALDPDVLEVASEALSQLGGQDRLVGVITHVAELAERLPVRIEVQKLAGGSRLQRVS